MRVRDLPKVWSYSYPSYSAINNPPSPKYPFKAYCIPASYSLPFARNLSRYFGGDLESVPADGYGTDYYINLTARDLVFENLPSASRAKTVAMRDGVDTSWVLNLCWPDMAVE
jgi:hypothetical protein